jgi:hypothetical protein
MGIIAESWLLDERVQLKVHRLSGAHRLAGALALGVPRRGEALMFLNCRSVHGWFIRERLDVVFVDAGGRVLRATELTPWRVRTCARASHCLEFAQGECTRLGITTGSILKNI